jgi:hypothetical protein
MSTGENKFDSEDPDCHQCRHYHMTWEPYLPHGCRRYGFRSRLIPSREVRLADGEACLAFTPVRGILPEGGLTPGPQRRYDKRC